ncbi:MAG: hypothetical protein IPG22_17340 [Acidobacteria bacterium]|nr:hypothetical protein [Acidobacteriota bacterium]
MAIENEDILALKQTISLADVVRSRGVELRKKGRQLWGLCPFHEDTEPSFAVDERKGLWNCLGKCGEGRGRVQLCDESGRDRLCGGLCFIAGN